MKELHLHETCYYWHQGYRSLCILMPLLSHTVLRAEASDIANLSGSWISRTSVLWQHQCQVCLPSHCQSQRNLEVLPRVADYEHTENFSKNHRASQIERKILICPLLVSTVALQRKSGETVVDKNFLKGTCERVWIHVNWIYKNSISLEL